jgi:RHH-type rel operon transcriptional repressor/antitoxin RelB
MAVSVRMEPLLEKDLEQAARRQGITKSQFIVDAVQRALGRKNPYDLLLQVQNQPPQVRERSVPYLAGKPVVAGADADMHEASATVHGDASLSERLRQKLRVQHTASVRDWLAYQDAKKRGVAWVPDEQEPAA